MSVPLATLFYGDVAVEQGSDITQFGWGDLTVNRNCIIKSTQEATGGTIGALSVAGGVSVALTANFNKDKSNGNGNALNVLYGKTNLTETHIDTTLGPTTITGGNRVDILVGSASQFVTSSGNLSLISQLGTLQLHGGLNSPSAIDIKSLNIDGGVYMLSGQNGGISLIAGSSGVNGVTSSGNINLVANNASGNFSVNSSMRNQNLTFSLNGGTDSQVKIESSGINTTLPALVIKTTNTNGNIEISNAQGLGSGSLQQLVGSGGFTLRTNTGGSVSIKSQGAGSSYEVDTSTNSTNQHLTVGLNGNSDSSLIIKSSGTNDTNNAMIIQTINTRGNIIINQPDQSIGKIQTKTGSGGFLVDASRGSVQMTSYGATSLYTNATIADNQDLTISVTGDTNSKVNISSSGKGSQAVYIQTTNGTGGIHVNSVGGLQLQSGDTNSGVQIATATAGVPVRIGTNTSVTTILGDLYVRGETSSVDQQVVTIDDNIIVVNNAPYGTSDGGIAIKRFQAANNQGSGEVVRDTSNVTGIAQGGGSTSITLSNSASNEDNYYNGWWLKITSGTGEKQVRRIKSYEGATRTATIYSTVEQNGILGNPQPVEGMDFVTYPENGTTYALYPCHYVMSIWDESENEFALVCSANNPSDPNNPSFEPTISHYSNLRLNNLKSNGIFTQYINNALADGSTTIELSNSSTAPVSLWTNLTIPLFPKYGVYMVFVKPADLSLSNRSHGIFMLGRVNNISTPGTVVRLISVKGTMNDQLDMQWRANEYPEIYFRPAPGGAGGMSTTYKVKIITL
jgi:hypothetical protein